MESLSRWFEALIPGGADGKPVVITCIGSGGKTTLIWLLARRLSGKLSGGGESSARKVLVTPSTKMFIPAPAELFFDHYHPGPPPEPRPGISLAGTFNTTSGKLESLPAPELARIRGGYDVVLIEGDGSRALPLKGWADHEPQVPAFTTITAGVIPLSPLGKPLDEKNVHRLPLFCALSGASPGEILKPEHLAAVISGGQQAGTASVARGLFASALGKKILFINQVEDEAAFDAARGLAALLPPAFRAGLRIIAGSARLDTAREL